MRIGHRRKRGRVVATGILLIVLAGSLTALLGIARWGGVEIKVPEPTTGQ